MSRKKPDPEPSPRLPAQRPGPAGGKRDENRRLKRELLLQEATALFKRQGVEGVTIDEIVAAAEISKGSFYHYFESKAELVRILYGPIRVQIEAAFTGAKERMRLTSGEAELFATYQQMATEMAQACMAVPDLVLIYLTEQRGARTEARLPIIELAESVMQHALELTQIAQQQNLLRPFDPRISSLAVIGSIEVLALQYLRSALDFHPVELTATLIAMVLEGLQP